MARLDFPSSSVTSLYNISRPEITYLGQYEHRPAATSISRTLSIPNDNEREIAPFNMRDEEYFRIRNTFREIRKNCQLLGLEYDDVDFPPTKASLIRDRPTTSARSRHNVAINDEERFPTVTRWLRPGDISSSGRGNDMANDWVLISDPSPSDIRQGQLGNCWFIAALTLIAERKELISNIFISRKFNPVGVYALRLFKDGQWTGVIIDDFFPCDAYDRLVFSSNRRRQLWVPLIEKAMAKLHGTYASLQSGLISDGLNYLTGFVSEHIDLETEGDRELLWGKLLSLHSAEFLMGAHITCLDASKSKLFKETKGLVTNHVYAVLKVVSENSHRLIQLRNPWGKFSWKGDWSDDSALWTRDMKARFSPNRSEEGIFWISYRDFYRHFTSVEVCKVRKNWKITSVHGILPPFVDPDCQPCFEIICEQPCEVDISLYQSSKRNADEEVKQTDIGLMVLETNGASSSSRQYRLVKPVELTLSHRQRSVSCNIMLAPGNYCVVPYSFGHWTTKSDDDTFYTFALTIHSSRDIKFSSIRPKNYDSILADALICCSKFYGDRKKYALKENNDEISTITFNLEAGHCMILENYTNDKYVELAASSVTDDYTSTREAFCIKDKIPPMHCQVVQVLTSKDTGKTTRYQSSYKLHITHKSRERNYGTNTHEPPLHERIVGLHMPRPILL